MKSFPNFTIDLSNCLNKKISNQFKQRISQGSLTRDENPADHFCVSFCCYSLKNKRFFITHHKKSGLWMFPGGHIDRNESPEETLYREMKEELGFICAHSQNHQPILNSIFSLNDIPNNKCKIHYEIFYAIPAEKEDFQIDPKEFLDTKWATLEEAEKLMTNNSSSLLALKRLYQIINRQQNRSEE